MKEEKIKQRGLPKIFYTSDEVSTLLGISTETLYRFVREKRISPIKIRAAQGKNIKYCKSYFLPESVISFISWWLPLLTSQERKSIWNRLRKG